MKRVILGTCLLAFLLIANSCLETPETSNRLVEDVAIIDQYLADNNVTGVIKDITGLRIKIFALGDGPMATLENKVHIEYAGYLLGSVSAFDAQNTSGHSNNTLNGYIEGWKYAIPYLPVGTTADIYIPSPLAYGASGSGAIPPNAILRFRVEIQNVLWTTVQQDRFEDDTVAIENYLDENQINYEEGDFGVRYTIVEQGTGASPSIYDIIGFNIRRKYIDANGDAVLIDEVVVSETLGYRLMHFPNAMKYALPLISQGGKIHIYSPSAQAYASQAGASFPANAKMIFEIELTNVED